MCGKKVFEGWESGCRNVYDPYHDSATVAHMKSELKKKGIFGEGMEAWRQHALKVYSCVDAMFGIPRVIEGHKPLYDQDTLQDLIALFAFKKPELLAWMKGKGMIAKGDTMPKLWNQILEEHVLADELDSTKSVTNQQQQSLAAGSHIEINNPSTYQRYPPGVNSLSTTYPPHILNQQQEFGIGHYQTVPGSVSNMPTQYQQPAFIGSMSQPYYHPAPSNSRATVAMQNQTPPHPNSGAAVVAQYQAPYAPDPRATAVPQYQVQSSADHRAIAVPQYQVQSSPGPRATTTAHYQAQAPRTPQSQVIGQPVMASSSQNPAQYTNSSAPRSWKHWAPAFLVSNQTEPNQHFHQPQPSIPSASVPTEIKNMPTGSQTIPMSDPTIAGPSNSLSNYTAAQKGKSPIRPAHSPNVYNEFGMLSSHAPSSTARMSATFDDIRKMSTPSFNPGESVDFAQLISNGARFIQQGEELDEQTKTHYTAMQHSIKQLEASHESMVPLIKQLEAIHLSMAPSFQQLRAATNSAIEVKSTECHLAHQYEKCFLTPVLNFLQTCKDRTGMKESDEKAGILDETTQNQYGIAHDSGQQDQGQASVSDEDRVMSEGGEVLDSTAYHLSHDNIGSTAGSVTGGVESSQYPTIERGNDVTPGSFAS